MPPLSEMTEKPVGPTIRLPVEHDEQMPKTRKTTSAATLIEREPELHLAEDLHRDEVQ